MLTDIVQLSIGSAGAIAASDANLARGVVAGAVILAAAFLAGVAVLGRSATAFCALLTVASGGALAMIGLGLIQGPPPTHLQMLAAVFAASGVFFVSSAVSVVRNNALLGGVMFAAAISLIGVGVINVALNGEAAGLLRLAFFVAGGGVALVAIAAALRGDAGAQLILPGAVLAGLGPAAAPLLESSAFGLGSITANALFAAGVVSASVLAATEAALSRGRTGGRIGGFDASSVGEFGRGFAADRSSAPGDASARAGATGRAASELRVSENQLAEVLDYAGVSVLDWSATSSHQSASFSALIGSEDGGFTPDSLRAFLRAEDRARYNVDVLGVGGEDGSFDETLGLLAGGAVRLRGARAVAPDGTLERVVMFAEKAQANGAASPALASAASALTAAAEAAPHSPSPGAGSTKEEAGGLGAGAVEARFQPIVRLRDRTVVGHEALLRWPASEKKTADGEAVAADDIARGAILAGRGGDLARLMVDAAAARAAAENAKFDAGAGRKPVFCAFNVSASQALNDGFVDLVKAALEKHAPPAQSLVLELTEAERIEDPAKAETVFRALKELGVGLALDDFGAGFTSIANLHRHAFDYMKIDKSFIRRIADDRGAAKIVSALSALARDFGMTVIAEGVEDGRAAGAASVAGCALGQGFHFGAPAAPPAPAPETVSASETPSPAASTDRTPRKDERAAAATAAPSDKSALSTAKPTTDTALERGRAKSDSAPASDPKAVVALNAAQRVSASSDTPRKIARDSDNKKPERDRAATASAADKKSKGSDAARAAADAAAMAPSMANAPWKTPSERAATRRDRRLFAAKSQRSSDAGERATKSTPTRRDAAQADSARAAKPKADASATSDEAAARTNWKTRADEPIVLDANLQAVAPVSRLARRSAWRRDLR